MSVVTLTTPRPGGPNTFLFTMGALPGGYLWWFGTRYRRIWLDTEKQIVTERRHLFGLQFERHVAVNMLRAAVVHKREVPVPRPLWRRLLSPTRAGSTLPTITRYQLELASANPPLLLDNSIDQKSVRARADEVAKAGGWKVEVL